MTVPVVDAVASMVAVLVPNSNVDVNRVTRNTLPIEFHSDDWVFMGGDFIH